MLFNVEEYYWTGLCVRCWAVLGTFLHRPYNYLCHKKQNDIFYSIIEASLVSKMWSVRIQGMDISMGN